MNRILFTCRGGQLILPAMPLVSRADGGNLVVNPPRTVWERAELTPRELADWSYLVAATGYAMLDALPQLAGGCINYWEAGNWALNEQAEPRGAKTAPAHRQVHLHLLGRSRTATHPAWRWGEAPKFPDYAARQAWAADFAPLTAEECCAIVGRVETRLRTFYELPPSALMPWAACVQCGYTTPGAAEQHCTSCLKTG
ncbi:MAG TPA: hypothetical protein PKA34_10115 [Blastocatellia bacterium]|nr:hypothetical protein [Blastocatellia bacterium]HNG34828.1 hypothetical protein [Blastocatellia bacterium]